MLGEALLHFLGEAANTGVVQVRGKHDRLLGQLSRHLILLTFHVAGVLGGDFDLLGLRGAGLRRLIGHPLAQGRIGHARPSQEIQ
jgi:hypothetical protein